jgi:hypothetical protein
MPEETEHYYALIMLIYAYELSANVTAYLVALCCKPEGRGFD